MTTLLIILTVLLVLGLGRRWGKAYQKRRLAERVARYLRPGMTFSYAVWQRGPGMATCRSDGDVNFIYPFEGWRNVPVIESLDVQPAGDDLDGTIIVER